MVQVSFDGLAVALEDVQDNPARTYANLNVQRSPRVLPYAGVATAARANSCVSLCVAMVRSFISPDGLTTGRSTTKSHVRSTLRRPSKMEERPTPSMRSAKRPQG